MAAKTTDYAAMNVHQKLIIARKMFMEGGAKKTGKNPALEFKYFELNDIVPLITEIFSEVGLVALVSYDNDTATMNVVNTDKPDESIPFTSPMRFTETNRGVNPLQALGASHTYLRRYLYMMVMDICEADSIEPTIKKEDDTAEAPAKNKKPATTAERAEIKQELTAPDEPASQLQIEALIAACNALMDKDADQEEFVQNVALQTNGFKDITKSQCETLINGINEALTHYKEV